MPQLIAPATRRSTLTAAGIATLVLLLVGVLAGNERVQAVLLNTIWLVGSVVVISLPIGILLALFLARLETPGRRLLLLCWAMAVLIPLYLQAAAWEAGFGTIGWFTLQQEHLQRPWLDGWRGAVWIHSAAAIPWVILIMYVAFRNPATTQEEAASLDASPAQVFFLVTLRNAFPGVALSGLWVASLTATEITITDMKQIRTFAEETFMSYALGEQPLTIGWMLVFNGALLGIAVAALHLITSYLTPGRLTATSAARTFPVSAGIRRVLNACQWLALFALLFIPIANLVNKAGVVVTDSSGQRIKQWSLSHFSGQYFGALSEFKEEYFWSLSIGLTTALFAVCLSTLLATAMSNRWLAGIIILILGLCLATPGPVIGHLTVLLLNNPNIPPLVWLYDETITAPVLTLTVRALPLTTLIIWFAIGSVPPTTIAAAKLDGCNYRQLFWRIIFPQRRAYWLLAGFVAFALSWSEVGSLNHMVVPPDMWLVSQRIFDLIHYGVEDRLAGFSLMTLTGFALLTAVVTLLFRWLQQPRSY